MGIDLNKKPAPVIKITDPVPKPKEEGFTKEEIDLLNSMSIEEAFKKGLI